MANLATLTYTAEMRRGFTLLELAVTLAVVGILAAVALPTFSGTTRRTRSDAEVVPLFSDIRNRLEQYLQENGEHPPTVGEATWNPSPAPGARVPLDLTAPSWSPLKMRPSGDSSVLCRYTFATGPADSGTNIGPEATSRFGFTAPSCDWYYLLAKCDTDGDPSAFSWYFTSSVDTTTRRSGEGQ